MQVANINAGREREIAEFKIQQDEAVANCYIEKNRQIQNADVARKLSIEQAEIDKLTQLIAKNREQQQAEIARQQAIEVANRQKETAVRRQGKGIAEARAAALAAEADREKAAQAVITVTVTSEADREAQKKLIAARQEADQNKIKEQTNADVLAYMRLKEADADVLPIHVRGQAAPRRGRLAVRLQACRGRKVAQDGLDVNVEGEKVGVEKARVDVERVSLANKQEFEVLPSSSNLTSSASRPTRKSASPPPRLWPAALCQGQHADFRRPRHHGLHAAAVHECGYWPSPLTASCRPFPPEAKTLLANLGTTIVSQMPSAKKSDRTGKQDAP